MCLSLIGMRLVFNGVFMLLCVYRCFFRYRSYRSCIKVVFSFNIYAFAMRIEKRALPFVDQYYVDIDCRASYPDGSLVKFPLQLGYMYVFKIKLNILYN